jgi:hypothetical protein
MNETEMTLKTTNNREAIKKFIGMECSFIYFGEHMAIQNKHYCTLCDPKLEYPFCPFCTSCHLNCSNAGGTIQVNTEEAFICHCGKELRHEIRKHKINSCNLSSLTNEHPHYLCNACNKGFCILCNAFCHYNCPGQVQQVSTVSTCNCEDNYHHLNDYLLHKEKVSVIQDLTKHSCPYQLTYNLIEYGVMDNLIELIRNNLRKNDVKKINESERYKVNDIFDNFNDLITNFPNYYFHKRLREVFNYNFMSELFIQGKHDCYYFYTLFFIYYFELQDDFKFYTKFSAKDYLCSTVAERLQNRSLFLRTVSPEIQSKYKIYDCYAPNSEYSLVNFILKVAGFFDIQLEEKSLAVMLEVIEFGLKIHIFPIEKLIELITILYKKYDFTYNKKIIKDLDVSNINIVETLTNILYIISINYNDLVTLQLYTDNNNSYPFIHSISQHGLMLFKLIIINMGIFSYNFSAPQPLLGSETLIINNESLKLFAITNNSYMINLDILRTEGFVAYNDFDKLASLINLSDSQEQFSDLILKLKTDLLSEYRKHHEQRKTDVGILPALNRAFSSFQTECDTLLRSQLQEPKSNCDEKISRLRKKLQDSVKNTYPFVDLLNTEKQVYNFITHIRVSNVIEAFTSILSINLNSDNDSNHKDIQNLISYIVGFSKLLLLDAEGASALLKGNFLDKLNSYLNHDANNEILEFYTILFKSCKLYQINLTNCHYVSLIIGNIMDKFSKKTDKGIKPLIIFLEILFNASLFIDKEIFKIAFSFIIFDKDSVKFLNAEKFEKSFEKAYEEQYSLETHFLNVIIADNATNEYRLTDNSETQRLINYDLVNKLGLDTAVNINNNISDTDEIRFYISVMKLFTRNVFYTYYNDTKIQNLIENLKKCFPVNSFSGILNSSFINLFQRRHIINYLVRLNFLENIELHDDNKFFATLDYENYINEKPFDEKKFKQIDMMVHVVDLLCLELTNSICFLFDSKDSLKNIRKYLKALILNVKFVSEYIYLKKRIFKENFSNHVSLYFFRLGCSLLKSSNLLRSAFTCVRDASDITDFRKKLMNDFIICKTKGFASDKLPDLENIDNLFNTGKIFEMVFEEIQSLNNIIDFLSEFDMKKFLYQHDKTFRMNFFTKGLVYEGDYKVIYRDFHKEKKQGKIAHCAKLNSIYFFYINTFFDIDNTNMIYTLQNITTESYYNFRNIFVNYFISYIENSKHVSDEFEIDMFLMVTKYLYFDGKNAQNSFQEFLKTALNFFPFLYYKLIKSIGLCYNTACNFYTQNTFYKTVNTSSQLILQFLQLLSEGYNLSFKSLIINSLYLPEDRDNIAFKTPDLFEEETLSFLVKRYKEKSLLRVAFNLAQNNEFDNEILRKDFKTEEVPLDNAITSERVRDNEDQSYIRERDASPKLKEDEKLEINNIQSKPISKIRASYNVETPSHKSYGYERMGSRTPQLQKIKINTKSKKNDMDAEEEKDLINTEFLQVIIEKKPVYSQKSPIASYGNYNRSYEPTQKGPIIYTPTKRHMDIISEEPSPRTGDADRPIGDMARSYVPKRKVVIDTSQRIKLNSQPVEDSIKRSGSFKSTSKLMDYSSHVTFKPDIKTAEPVRFKNILFNYSDPDNSDRDEKKDSNMDKALSVRRTIPAEIAHLSQSKVNFIPLENSEANPLTDNVTQVLNVDNTSFNIVSIPDMPKLMGKEKISYNNMREVDLNDELLDNKLQKESDEKDKKEGDDNNDDGTLHKKSKSCIRSDPQFTFGRDANQQDNIIQAKNNENINNSSLILEKANSNIYPSDISGRQHDPDLKSKTGCNDPRNRRTNNTNNYDAKLYLEPESFSQLHPQSIIVDQIGNNAVKSTPKSGNHVFDNVEGDASRSHTAEELNDIYDKRPRGQHTTKKLNDIGVYYDKKPRGQHTTKELNDIGVYYDKKPRGQHTTKELNDIGVYYDKRPRGQNSSLIYTTEQDEQEPSEHATPRKENVRKRDKSKSPTSSKNSIVYYPVNIVNTKPSVGNFYGFCYDTFSILRRYIILDSNLQYTLPNDNLLMLTNNIMNFLIEYNHICTSSDYSIHELLGNDEKFLRQIKWLLFNRDEELNTHRTTISRFIKIKYIQLLISIVRNKYFESLAAKLNLKINIFNLYEEIIYYMDLIVKEMKEKGFLPLTSSLNNENIKYQLLDLYIFKPWFSKTPEFIFCLSAFKYIKISSASFHSANLDIFYEENKERILTEKTIPNSMEFIANSKAGYNVYKYFSEIIGLVEVEISNSGDDKVQNDVVNNEVGYNRSPIFYTSHDTVNNINNTNSDGKLSVFFVKPPITFLLADQTKQYFKDNVNRTNGTTKHAELFRNTDYFIYEMLYNYKFAVDGLLNRGYPIIRKIQMKHFEILNYLFILIHQVILINYYYKKDIQAGSDTELFSDNDKFTPCLGNFVFAIIHILTLACFITFWIFCFAKLSYQKAIMKEYDIKYLITGDEGKKKVKFLKFTDNFIIDNKDLLIPTDKDLTFYQKLNILILHLLVFNRNINIFIFTFLCLLVFLCSSHSIFIVIPVLFISNMIELLSNITYAVQLKWKQLSMVLVFTYMIVYFFSWISFFYIYKVFDSEVFESVYVIFVLIFSKQQ